MFMFVLASDLHGGCICICVFVVRVIIFSHIKVTVCTVSLYM